MSMNKFIPNSFQVPNAVIDELMDDLKDVEFRCYMTLIRQTTGWNKQFDFISVSQFQKFTGRGKTAITAAMQRLQKMGLVLEREQTKNGVKCYELDMVKLAEWGIESDLKPVQKVNGSKSEPVQKVNGGGSKSEPEPVQKVNTQNTNNKTHSTKNNNVLYARAKSHKNDLQTLHDLGVDEQLAQDWLQTRKDKRAGSLTPTVVSALEREAAKAGLTVPQAVQVAAERNWARFMAAYLHNEQQGFSGSLHSGCIKPNRITQIPKHPAGVQGSTLARDVFAELGEKPTPTAKNILDTENDF